MDITIGSNNPYKLRELRDILAPYAARGVRIVAAPAGSLSAVEETGRTFEANARLKAETWARETGGWVLADDSGLEVDALDGEPGVDSAMYAGRHGDDGANNRKLLEALRGVPEAKRTARYRCVLALAGPTGVAFTVEGHVEGRILETPRGSGGFGYDPLFYFPPLARAFGELSDDEKHRHSHRGRALAVFRERFAAWLAGLGNRKRGEGFMDKPEHYVVSLDLGGTNLRGGVFNRHGECLVRGSTESHGKEGGDAVFAAMLQFLRGLPGQAGLDWEKIGGIGVGAPGPVDPAAGVINFAPNIEGWVQFPIGSRLYAEFKRPVFLNNDALAAGIGEHWLGAARGMANVVMLTLGTGIGGAIFVNGRPYGGAGGKAGELGHMTVNPFGRACGCGNIGCLEAHSSSRAVVTRYQFLAKSGKRSALAKIADKVTFKAIAEAARDGDGLCQQVILDAAEYLGIGVASIINIFNPEAVVLGGGMIGAAELMLPRVKEQIDRRALIASAENCKVIVGMLGDDAGILGAAKWTLDALEISA